MTYIKQLTNEICKWHIACNADELTGEKNSGRGLKPTSAFCGRAAIGQQFNPTFTPL
jgi:hypothetical protein